MDKSKIKFFAVRKAAARLYYTTGQTIPPHLYDDLYQICDIKIWQCQEKYDGIHAFTTYVYKCLSRQLHAFLLKNMYPISGSVPRRLNRVDVELVSYDPEYIDIPFYVLSEREEKIVKMHYTMGFREIAQSLGVTGQRVQQIYHRALKKLRQAIDS